MENEKLKQTKFDSMVTNKNMQLAKAVIPYIDNGLGNYIGMIIKLKELQNAAKINSRVSVSAMNYDKHNNNIENMLEDIKDFLSDNEKETIDTIMSMMEMMKTMEGMDMDGNTMQDFMNSMNMGDDGMESFMGNFTNMFGG